MEKKKIDRLFSDAFQDAESTPPADMWSKIEAELDLEPQEITLSKRKIFPFYKYAAAIALFAIGIALYVNRESEKTVLTETSHLTKKDKAVHSLSKKNAEKDIPKIVTQKDLPKERHQALPEKQFVQFSPGTAPKKRIQKALHELKTTPTISNKIVAPDETITAPIQLAISTEKKLQNNAPVTLTTRQVTEIEPLKPLIEPEEDLESMYAVQASSPHKTVVTSLLNIISENIEVSPAADLRFRADDEGSIRIDFINSLVKNRSKKRK